MAIQSVLENHLCCLMSATPFLRFPKRFVRSTWSWLRRKSLISALKWDGNRTWNNHAPRRSQRPSNIVWNTRIAPTHLADEFLRSSDLEARGRLCSASSSSLIVRRLSATELFRSPLPPPPCLERTTAPRHVTSAPSTPSFRLKTHLFRRSFPDFL